MKRIHTEFAYQSRELGVQIEDTLGDPPNRKNYARVIQSLLDEFARGTEINDVNLLSFALVDHLRFQNPAELLAEAAQYDRGDAAKVLSGVSCSDESADRALTNVAATDPELARRAIITAFLYKHPKRWSEEDHSLETLQKSENGNDDEEQDQLAPGHDIEHLFDANDHGAGHLE